MIDLRLSLALTAVNLLVSNPISVGTTHVDVSDDDLTTMLIKVDGAEFGGLKMTAMRGYQIDLVGAAAWTVMIATKNSQISLSLTRTNLASCTRVISKILVS